MLRAKVVRTTIVKEEEEMNWNRGLPLGKRKHRDMLGRLRERREGG